MIPGSIDPECEAVSTRGGCLCGKQTEMEGERGMVMWAVPPPPTHPPKLFPLSLDPPPPPWAYCQSHVLFPAPPSADASLTCFLAAGPPSSLLDVPLGSSLLCLPLSAAACTVLARLVTDLFTCNPSLLVFFFFLLLCSAWQCCFTLRCWAGWSSTGSQSDSFCCTRKLSE